MHFCSDSSALRQTTTAKSNVTTCSFPLLDAAKFETRARRTDNAAVLVKGKPCDRYFSAMNNVSMGKVLLHR